MKAVWAAAALLIGLGLLAAYAVTRPREIWIFEFRTPTGLREVEFPRGTARQKLIPVLRAPLEQSLLSSGPPDRFIFRWTAERRTRSWAISWPPLRTDRLLDTVGKSILEKRSDGRWEVASDGSSTESSFPTLEQALDEALRRLLPPD